MSLLNRSGGQALWGEPEPNPQQKFDGREEAGNETEDPQIESNTDHILQWFWFFSVMALFFGGVAISYYIIHHPN